MSAEIPADCEPLTAYRGARLRHGVEDQWRVMRTRGAILGNPALERCDALSAPQVTSAMRNAPDCAA